MKLEGRVVIVTPRPLDARGDCRDPVADRPLCWFSRLLGGPPNRREGIWEAIADGGGES
jgi:hypothetical protein